MKKKYMGEVTGSYHRMNATQQSIVRKKMNSAGSKGGNNTVKSKK